MKKSFKRILCHILAVVLVFSAFLQIVPEANAASYTSLSGLYELRPSNATSTRLDVSGGSTKDKANIQIYTSNHTLAQQFYLVEAAEKGKYYYIVSKVSGKVLDVSGGKGKSGDNVIQYKNKRGKNQQWKLIPTNGGYYIVPRINESLALTATGRGSGANVCVQTRTSNKSQIWQLGKSNVVSGLTGCTMSNPKSLSATFSINTTGNRAKFTVDPLTQDVFSGVYKTTSCNFKITIYSGGKVIKTQNITESWQIDIPKGYSNVVVRVSENTGIIARGDNLKGGVVACQLTSLKNCVMAG